MGAPTQPLQCLAVDTIERVRDGIRRYLVVVIDPASAFALAVALPSKATCPTPGALCAALDLLPEKPQVLLSDNGSEFGAGFARLLKQQGISRWYIYPKSPRTNAYAERFKRTLQESFVDYHENLLFTDLALFNPKRAQWLIFTNAQRRHPSTRTRNIPILPYLSPTKVPKVVSACINWT